MPPHPARVVVIGGGAAGFFGAIACGERSGGRLDIRILEGGRDVLQKVKISGGGRCNVTHDEDDPRILSEFYPRGRRALIGPLSRWRQSDTVSWFAEHGVELHSEEDGRMFPVSNTSSTVVNCLQEVASSLYITVETGAAVNEVLTHVDRGFKVVTRGMEDICCDAVLIATGGVRNALARAPVESTSHIMAAPVPSLFTFKINEPGLTALAGVSVKSASISVPGGSIAASGPLLVTHWGLSGPAVLKISSWGARELAARHYRFTIKVDWSGGTESEDSLRRKISGHRQSHGARRVIRTSIVDGIPRRLWSRLASKAGITEETLWSSISKQEVGELCHVVLGERMQVDGKSMNKEEFVTCGGVDLKDIDLKTMQSLRFPGVYFAGEVLDIDGLTGGFNFQSAWTTGRIAGEAIAEKLLP